MIKAKQSKTKQTNKQTNNQVNKQTNKQTKYVLILEYNFGIFIASVM